MGQHFVPQRYLRNFQSPKNPGFIWLHDKKTGQSRLTNIRRVAQSKQYYSAETETLLAQQVEEPANAVIQKLNENERPDDAERLRLTFYLGTMLKRVPYSRRKAMETYPGVLDETVALVRQQIMELARNRPDADPEVVARRLAELEAVQAKFESKPPDEIIQQVREPWASPDMLDAIYRMTWRVLISVGPQYFITTDNPGFFFGAYGLATPKAELCFPLSTTHALHGSSQGVGTDTVFLQASQQLVKEVNRRLASATERHAFYYERAPWLEHVLRKKDPYLSVIKW